MVSRACPCFHFAQAQWENKGADVGESGRGSGSAALHGRMLNQSNESIPRLYFSSHCARRKWHHEEAASTDQHFSPPTIRRPSGADNRSSLLLYGSKTGLNHTVCLRLIGDAAESTVHRRMCCLKRKRANKFKYAVLSSLLTLFLLLWDLFSLILIFIWHWICLIECFWHISNSIRWTQVVVSGHCVRKPYFWSSLNLAGLKHLSTSGK